MLLLQICLLFAFSCSDQHKEILAQYGSDALYVFASFHSDQHKEILARYEGDVLQLLLKVLTSHPNMSDVQGEAISTIACLADIGGMCVCLAGCLI